MIGKMFFMEVKFLFFSFFENFEKASATCFKDEKRSGIQGFLFIQITAFDFKKFSRTF